MGKLIAVIILLSATLLALLAAFIRLRVRIYRMFGRVENFLTGYDEPMEISIREDSLASLHNAISELQNQLRHMQEQIREERERTSNLTADISHQLKTPLASLRLFCEMDASAHVDEQLSQIDRMERLVYSLLRLERLCANGYDFSFKQCDVRQIIERAWESLESVYSGRRIRIDGNAVLRCDEKWMGEAFLNLMKNACEHTDAGLEILICIETTPSMFFATITDEGGGVDEKDLPHLFERFYRAKGSESNGVGIGLAIVREIIHRHHGDIYAENASHGLKIRIIIPILNLAKS